MDESFLKTNKLIRLIWLVQAHAGSCVLVQPLGLSRLKLARPDLSGLVQARLDSSRLVGAHPGS